MSQPPPPPSPPSPLLPAETHRHSSLKTASHSLWIIVLILTITVAVSILLCLLLRHLNRHCLSHLAPSSAASAATESRRISTRRVNPETSATALPLFTYSAITRRSSTTVAADCAVCLSKFEPADELRLLPLCCHAFHAVCIDTWLQSQQTCPLCRSAIAASDSDLMALVSDSSAAPTNGNGGSFRLEIGNVSRPNNQNPIDQHDSTNRSYSVGSFDYVVEDDSSEVQLSNALKDDVVLVIAEPEPPIPHSSLAAEVGSGMSSWLKDYIDRLSSSLSSRDISFRSSGRFYTGSSRRSEVSFASDRGEAGVGEEISEMFRWLSGV